MTTTSGTRPGSGIALEPWKLARLRNERLLSREELASTAGISLSALAKIENGMRRPRTSTLRKICDALGCDPSELIAT